MREYISADNLALGGVDCLYAAAEVAELLHIDDSLVVDILREHEVEAVGEVLIHHGIAHTRDDTLLVEGIAVVYLIVGDELVNAVVGSRVDVEVERFHYLRDVLLGVFIGHSARYGESVLEDVAAVEKSLVYLEEALVALGDILREERLLQDDVTAGGVLDEDIAVEVHYLAACGSYLAHIGEGIASVGLAGDYLITSDDLYLHQSHRRERTEQNDDDNDDYGFDIIGNAFHLLLLYRCDRAVVTTS